MGGGSTTTSNTIDPKLMALIQANYKTAQGVANRPYQPYTGEGVAGFSPDQTQAQGILGNVATGQVGTPAMNNAVGSAQSILGNIQNTPTLAGTDLSPYMNPFQNDVINATLRQMDQFRGMQGVANNQQATQDNAFGGNRQGVADALTNQYYDQNAAQTLANLNAQNFGQAQNAAEYDINRGLSANQLGLQGANDLANLGNQQFGLAANQGSLLNAVGQTQQQQQQNLDNWNYQQFVNAVNYPIQQQDIRNAALSMMPLQGSSTSHQSTGIGGILGPALGAAGSALLMF